MSWTDALDRLDPSWLANLRPDVVLYDFDGPRIFTANVHAGLVLVYLVEEEPEFARYLVAPSSACGVEALRRGVSTVREVLSEGCLWVAEASFDGSVYRLWRAQVENLPDDVLPEEGVMLLPEL